MKLYLTKAAVAGATNRITIIMQYPISFLLRSSWFFLAMKNMTLPNNTAINGISKYDITNFPSNSSIYMYYKSFLFIGQRTQQKFKFKTATLLISIDDSCHRNYYTFFDGNCIEWHIVKINI